MSRYGYNFSGYNSGYSFGKSFFKGGRYKSKNSIENGCATLMVGIIALAFLGGKTGQANLVSLTQALMPLLIFLGIIMGLILVYREFRYYRLSKTGIFDIDKMTGTEFEERLMVLYRNLGYKVTHIGGTGDAGVDLIIEKYGRKTAVQAKRYQGYVGEAAVQQVHTGKDYYKCDDAILVSNSNFTQMAWKVAKATNIKLWSRNYLIKVLLTEHDKITINKLVEDIKSPIENTTTTTTSQPKPVATKELIQYISYCIKKGEKWNDLQIRLIKVGWNEEILNDAFFQYYNYSELKT